MASIAEDKPKIGSLIVSLYNRSTSVTTEIIPAKYEALLTRLTAEKLAVRMDGIAVLSVSVKDALSTGIAKEIMKEMDLMLP